MSKPTDIEEAKAKLEGHTLALCRDGVVITDDKRGVAPMVDHLRAGRSFEGYSAADRVVGKAAAMLFIKAGVRTVYAQVLSKSAEALFKAHAVDYSFDVLTERIRNRDNTGICPMEETVAECDDIELGFKLISDKLDALRNHA